MPPLATASDLTARGIDAGFAEVDVFLDVASEEVRQAAGSNITETTGTVSLVGRHDVWLRLPGAPVTAVSTVTKDGTALTDWKLADGRLWRRNGWGGTYRGEPAVVAVTYTYGLATVPADIVDLVCTMVAAAKSALDSADDGEGLAYDNGRLQSITIDGFSETYATSAEAMSAVTAMTLPTRARQRLAARFGGGAHMVVTE